MRPFQHVESPQIGRSVFDLSHSKLMSANMGLLYPILVESMVPGDSFNVSHSIVARVMPLVAPILHEINITVHTFFVPYRILWEDWEEFITGGVDGTDASVLPRMAYPATFDDSLWDFLGFPENNGGALTASDTLPLDFPKRAYNKIWNEYYRDETLQTEVVEDTSDVLLRRCWSKDYFSSALPHAQRGIAPSFPLSGNPNVVFNFGNLNNDASYYYAGFQTTPTVVHTTEHAVGIDYTGGTGADVVTANDSWNAKVSPAKAGVATVDLSSVTTFDVNDLRTAWQIQKWMERNARTGVRYTEFLQGHFGVGGNLDARLQRPEYVGGLKTNLIVSEVLQTSKSETGAPQGNMAGHGISVTQEHIGKYFAQEYGILMSILSITPKPMYYQGINRQWLYRTKYDFYFPEFSTLGEQEIELGELYWQNTDATNKTLFGFQGKYDEMRYKPNITVGDLRPGRAFDYWTLTRDFGSAPSLDSTFITCDPDPRSWAVQVGAPQFVMHIGNHIRAVRPIPAMGTPGLVDHH